MNANSKKSRGVRIGIVQMQCSDVPKENMEKALRMTREAAQKGAEYQLQEHSALAYSESAWRVFPQRNRHR